MDCSTVGCRTERQLVFWNPPCGLAAICSSNMCIPRYGAIIRELPASLPPPNVIVPIYIPWGRDTCPASLHLYSVMQNLSFLKPDLPCRLMSYPTSAAHAGYYTCHHPTSPDCSRSEILLLDRCCPTHDQGHPF